MGWICLRKRRQNGRKNKEVIETTKKAAFCSAKYFSTSLIQFNMKVAQNLNNGKAREEGRDSGREKHHQEWL